MKKLLVVFLLTGIVTVLEAQPCKTAKPGMTQAEVLEHTGVPLSIDTIGEHLDSRAILYDKEKAAPEKKIGGKYWIVWDYGEQEVQFLEDEMIQVDLGALKMREASHKFFAGEIDIFELEKVRNDVKIMECE